MNYFINAKKKNSSETQRGYAICASHTAGSKESQNTSCYIMLESAYLTTKAMLPQFAKIVLDLKGIWTFILFFYLIFSNDMSITLGLLKTTAKPKPSVAANFTLSSQRMAVLGRYRSRHQSTTSFLSLPLPHCQEFFTVIRKIHTHTFLSSTFPNIVFPK